MTLKHFIPAMITIKGILLCVTLKHFIPATITFMKVFFQSYEFYDYYYPIICVHGGLILQYTIKYYKVDTAPEEVDPNPDPNAADRTNHITPAIGPEQTTTDPTIVFPPSSCVEVEATLTKTVDKIATLTKDLVNIKTIVDKISEAGNLHITTLLIHENVISFN